MYLQWGCNDNVIFYTATTTGSSQTQSVVRYNIATGVREVVAVCNNLEYEVRYAVLETSSWKRFLSLSLSLSLLLFLLFFLFFFFTSRSFYYFSFFSLLLAAMPSSR